MFSFLDAPKCSYDRSSALRGWSRSVRATSSLATYLHLSPIFHEFQCISLANVSMQELGSKNGSTCKYQPGSGESPTAGQLKPHASSMQIWSSGASHVCHAVNSSPAAPSHSKTMPSPSKHKKTCWKHQRLGPDGGTSSRTKQTKTSSVGGMPSTTNTVLMHQLAACSRQADLTAISDARSAARHQVAMNHDECDMMRVHMHLL